MFRRRLLALLATVLVFAACTGTTTSTTLGDGSTTSTTSEPEPGSTSTTMVGTTTTSEMPPATAPDLSGLDVSDGLRQQLTDLMVRAQEIRQLPFLETPKITVLNSADFRVRIEAMLEEGMEDIDADEALYKLLGLLPAGANLETTLTQLYSEQVAGFYDGSVGEIVVPANASELTMLQQGTMLHELVHALTDQHFDFHSALEAITEAELYDQAAALRALIEGDATLSEVHWVQRLSQRELGQYIAESMGVDTSVLETVPEFIRTSLIFPYDAGHGFVQALHNRGGWDAVNEAYRSMPTMPGSTEQIITPEDFGRDLPIEVEAIPVEIPGYRLITTAVWGELGFRIMFNQVLGENASFRASDGWGGDFYHQWYDGRQAALLLVYKGDTANDVEEMRRALLDYQARAKPEQAFVWVAVREDRLFFILADDPEVGAQLRTAMGLE